MDWAVEAEVELMFDELEVREGEIAQVVLEQALGILLWWEPILAAFFSLKLYPLSTGGFLWGPN